MTSLRTPAPPGATAPPTARRGRTRGERLSALARQHGALAALVVIGLVATFSFDSFATPDNLRNMAVSSAFLAVIALGMTFVIVTGGIDLSVGSLFALGGVLAAWGSRHGTLVALLLPLVVCALFGLVNGLLIARSRLAPFIVTLAAMLAARGLLLTVTDEGATTYLVARTRSSPGSGRAPCSASASRRGSPLPSSSRAPCCSAAPASASTSTRSAATRTRPR